MKNKHVQYEILCFYYQCIYSRKFFFKKDTVNPLLKGITVEGAPGVGIKPLPKCKQWITSPTRCPKATAPDPNNIEFACQRASALARVPILIVCIYLRIDLEPALCL